MTNIEEIARVGAGETPTVPNQGLFGYVITERRHAEHLTETFVANGLPNIVDNGTGPVLATMDVPSIALAAEVFDRDPNYTQRLVRRLRDGGMNPYDLVHLYPDLVNEEYDPNADEDAADAWWDSVGRSIEHEALLMWLFQLSDGSMPDIVTTSTITEARLIATDNNIVIVSSPTRQSWSFVISPQFITRMLQRYAAMLDWMGSTQGVIYHSGLGDLTFGDEASFGPEDSPITWRMAVNNSPTTTIVVPNSIFPARGPSDVVARVRFMDHQIALNKRKGCAVYNTIPFRLYREFLTSFGHDDGMSVYEQIAMYTMTQASVGGFAQPDTWPTNVDFNIALNGESYIKDMPGIFFRDVDSADPRQMTPGELLNYIAMNVTMAVARDSGAKPFLAQAEVSSSDFPHASQRATVRQNFIRAHNPDEQWSGSNWFGHLPMRNSPAANPGAVGQNFYPTTIRTNTMYNPANRDSFNRLSHERDPQFNDTPLETMDIIDTQRANRPLTIEEGEDKVLTAANPARRYKLNVQSSRTLNSITTIGDRRFILVNLPTTPSGTTLNRRALAATPIRDLATHPTQVFYVGNHTFRPPRQYNDAAASVGATRAGSFLSEIFDPQNIPNINISTRVDARRTQIAPAFDYNPEGDTDTERGVQARVAGIAYTAAVNNRELTEAEANRVRQLLTGLDADGPAIRVPGRPIGPRIQNVPNADVNAAIDADEAEEGED